MSVCCLYCPLFLPIFHFCFVLFSLVPEKIAVTSSHCFWDHYWHSPPLRAGSQFWKAVSPECSVSLKSRAGFDLSLTLSLTVICVCILSAVPSSAFWLPPYRDEEWFPELFNCAKTCASRMYRDPYVHSLCFNERVVFRARRVCASVHMEAVGREDEGNAVQSFGCSSVATWSPWHALRKEWNIVVPFTSSTGTTCLVLISQCILLELATETRNPDWAMPLSSLFSLLVFELHPCSLWEATLCHAVCNCENCMGPLRENFISSLILLSSFFLTIPPNRLIIYLKIM